MTDKKIGYYYGPLTDDALMRQEEKFARYANKIVISGRYFYVVMPAFDKLITNGSIDLYDYLTCRWEHRMMLEDCLARCFEAVVVAARKDGYDITKQVLVAGRRTSQNWRAPRNIHYTLKGMSNV